MKRRAPAIVVLASSFIVVLACAKRTAPSAAPAPPASVAGTWHDTIGDAPWQIIELTARDDRHGHFAGTPFCNMPPCAPNDEGDYDVDGQTLRVHSPRLEGQSYTVKTAADVMEWRQNDVTIRRFKRVEQTAPSPAPPPFDYPSPGAARPVGTPCDTLTAQGCLLATDCVLERSTTKALPYLCRPASGPCEGGVAQSDRRFADDCAKRAGCTLRPAECFCPDAATKVPPPPESDEERLATVMCACAGGPPQRCERVQQR